MSWLELAVKTPCEVSRQAAFDHQQQLTKPPGSLGQLESVAVSLAALQQRDKPQVEKIAISIFAADHGIAQAGVSAFPQAVTAEMIRNFAGGGAAIAVLARHLNASLRVCNLGTVAELEAINGVESQPLGSGCNDFSKQAAMSEHQLQAALAVGKQHLEDAQDCDLWIGGEMGIANTTSATALACALLSEPARVLSGPGTGISSEQQQHKQRLIDAALALHKLDNGRGKNQSLDCLRRVGGFEIAALVGAYLRGAQLGIPMMVDGFIASVAALTALRLQPNIHPWLLLGHQSAEPGHAKIIAALDKLPLLQLQMRLGEGSGAACAVSLLQLACVLHNQMATFSSADVSTAL